MDDVEKIVRLESKLAILQFSNHELQQKLKTLCAENAKLTTKYWMAIEKISCNALGSCSKITEMHCNECIDKEIEDEIKNGE